MKLHGFTGTINMNGTERGVELTADGTLMLSGITTDEAKALVVLIEKGKAPEAKAPPAIKETAAKAAAGPPAAKAAPVEPGEPRSPLARRAKELASAKPKPAPATPEEPEEPEDEDEDATTDGSLEELPAEVVSATSLRAVLAYLVSTRETTDPAVLANECGVLRERIPILGRIKAESLSERIARTLQVMDI